MSERELTTGRALELAQRCVDHQRPLGWGAVAELLRELDRLRGDLVLADEQVAALNRALAQKRGRGIAGEPR